MILTLLFWGLLLCLAIACVITALSIASAAQDTLESLNLHDDPVYADPACTRASSPSEDIP